MCELDLELKVFQEYSVHEFRVDAIRSHHKLDGFDRILTLLH